jgi:ELWxxDGT repeat protein
MLFDGIDASVDYGLWVTDGTSGGTYELSGISGAFAGKTGNDLGPGDLTVFNGKVLFQGEDSSFLRGLWVTDGTAAGTSEIGGIGSRSISGANYDYGLQPSDLTVFNGKVLFVGHDNTYPKHPGSSLGNDTLWITDGTPAGTSEIGGNGNAGIIGVADPIQGGLSPYDLTVFNGEVLFGGVDASNHFGLWETDGTAAGTQELVAGISPFNLTIFNGEVLFDGSNASGLASLWVTDGTAAGTHELRGIRGANTTIGLLPANLTPFSSSTINPKSSSVLDFNGDGSSDLLWQNANSGQVGIWNSNGSGGFTNQIINQSDPTWQIQGTGDFNGDGSADMLWRNTNSGQVGLWDSYSNGSGGFTYNIINQSDFNWQIRGIGDFNGDGSSDILWTSTNAGEIGLWDSNGSGGFTYQTINQADPNWQVQGIGDFNGDGSSDILWRNLNSGLVGLWDSNGSGGFTYQISSQGDASWQIQGVGDFNGDGRSDILWRNTNSGQVGLWETNNVGAFTYQIFNESDPTWQIEGVGDFNGDGSSDILWRNSSSGQIGIWNSNGSGGFSYQTINQGDPSWNTFNGNDTLVASTANSTLFGNPGNTTFAIGPGAGQDKIYNFATSQDTLQFNPALFANFAAAMTHASQVGANTVFAIDANDSVTLENVNKSSLAASNFRFA